MSSVVGVGGDGSSSRERAAAAMAAAAVALPHLPWWRLPPVEAWRDAVRASDASERRRVAPDEVSAPEALVLLDLDLGRGRAERIPLWRGTKCRGVARAVAAAHSLGRQMETNLQLRLEQEMQAVTQA